MSKLLNGSTGDIVALATLAVLYLGGVGLALWRIRAAAPRGKLYWIVCIALLAGGAVAITQNLSPEHDHGGNAARFRARRRSGTARARTRCRRLRLGDVAGASRLISAVSAARPSRVNDDAYAGQR